MNQRRSNAANGASRPPPSNVARDMAGNSRAHGPDGRSDGSSPRPKGRENAKDTLCKNVTIYGHCRYQDKGCAFSHEVVKATQPQTQADNLRKRLNVDSPTFTPSLPVSNGVSPRVKSSTISPKAANAAPFKPKGVNAGTSTPPVLSDTPTTDWTSHKVQEFVPQAFESLHLGEEPPNPSTLVAYDGYSTPVSNLGGVGAHAHQAQINPYSQDAGSIPGISAGYFQSMAGHSQPLQYHLYAPLGPHRENLLPYQRTVHDFFISNTLREELQRKAEATLQVLPNSTLPAQIDHFHSLVPLDTSNQKNASIFGYPTWIYKAMSSKDGKYYALRRLEGYRLTNEQSIRSVQNWKRVDNSNVVTIHDAFTTGAFGDRSLIFVTDYHPLSKTLSEHHFGPGARITGRSAGPHIPEPIIWGYIVQIASALKTIHGIGLAARLIDPSKILLTDKSRIRLNACAMLDVIQHDNSSPLSKLQQDDLLQLGSLMLSLTSNNPAIMHQLPKAVDHLARSYSAEMRDCIQWLMAPVQNHSSSLIDQFLQGVAGHVATAFNDSLQLNDRLHTELNREVENGRLVRLMAKLNFINERPEFEHDRQWSETGDRYFLKLFRDFVFHQVDAQGNPVIDLAHVLSCLGKLDAGVDEKMTLISRDEQNCLIVSYKEVKRAVEVAFQELVRAGKRP